MPPPPDPRAVDALRRTLNLPPALCRLLAVRGFDTPELAKPFLRPEASGLHDPSLLTDARRAARRLAEAVGAGEMVVVHGDYDVDGIAAAALLSSWLRDLGGRAEAVVPDRVRHGYDLSQAGVDRARALGASVLVTVDCGIAAFDPVRAAAEAGMTVIVTDHHRAGESLPGAHAVVNPVRPGCPYPNKGLCGAAVAFKIGQLAAQMLGRPPGDAWERLDLVALATIADQVKLEGENRVLASFGLRALSQTPRPGLAALMRAAGMAPGTRLDASDVGFQLAPRINAAGRVGDADDALRLLLTSDQAEAAQLARRLDDCNAERKELERRVADEALERLAAQPGFDDDPVAVVGGDGWHSGVIGIVASRIVERLFRPAVVVAFDGDDGRGSARSIPSLDLHAAISACSAHLERFGGHAQAAGMDIRRDRLPAFRDDFRRAVLRSAGTERPAPEIAVDLEVGLDEIGPRLKRLIDYAGPFGQGNPEPVLVARNVALAEKREVRGGHFSFRLAQNGSSLRGIGFRMADALAPRLRGHSRVDAAFTLMENTYREHTTIEAKARDIRPAGSPG